jgi:hypothetical protein
VAVDLEAYSTQLQQAQAMPPQQMETAMNRFVTFRMWRWLALIISHHPDAQFVFIGTKADCIENTTMIQNTREDLHDRFEKWEKDRSNGQRKANETGQITPRPFNWVVVNPLTPDSVIAARQTLQQTITSREIGFPMGTVYSKVLRYVHTRREDARFAENGTQRIER